MTFLPLSRRETLGGLAATGALPLLSSSTLASPASETQAKALLDSFAEHLLDLEPGRATALGIDTGKRAPMRYHLGSSSLAARRRFAATIRTDLARADTIDTRSLSFPTRTSVEVVKSA